MEGTATMNQDISERLAARRKALGLSQEALAERIGVTRQAISKWERSESSPDTDNLIALAALYEVSLDDLLYEDVLEESAAGSRDTDTATNDTRTTTDDAKGDNVSTDTSATNSTANTAATACDTDETFETDASEGSVHVAPDGIHIDDGKDHVHVSLKDGVHVVDGKKGNTVHVSWDGVHVNDKSYDSVHDFHAANHIFAHDASHQKPKAYRIWMHFPFPALVVLAYLIIGLVTGVWAQSLFLAFTIPLYYAIGTCIGNRNIPAFVSSLYSIGALAWFCYEAFIEGQPHPAWVILLTIPLVCGIVAWAQHAFGKSRRSRQHH